MARDGFLVVVRVRGLGMQGWFLEDMTILTAASSSGLLDVSTTFLVVLWLFLDVWASLRVFRKRLLDTLQLLGLPVSWTFLVTLANERVGSWDSRLGRVVEHVHEMMDVHCLLLVLSVKSYLLVG